MTNNGESKTVLPVKNFNQNGHQSNSSMKNTPCILSSDIEYFRKEIIKKIRPNEESRDMLNDINSKYGKILQNYLTSESETLLTSYKNPQGEVIMLTSAPPKNIEVFMYFIKRHSITTGKYFHDFFQFGSICGNRLKNLHTVISQVYAPKLFKNQKWPESAQEDFLSGFSKFMAGLTESRYRIDNKTILYVPKEELNQNIKVSSKNKALVQRFEIVMVHWIKQIKDVLSKQDSTQVDDFLGPLEEINFWKNRCTDLSGISKQLDTEGVKKICAILESAKSSYTNNFKKLAAQIKDGTHEAEDNLKFISILKEPCLLLSEATPSEIPTYLNKITNLIRIIWINSSFYNTKDKITGLFKRLSNEIIKRCVNSVNVEETLSGYADSGILAIDKCIKCLEDWKKIYEKAVGIHSLFSKDNWVLDENAVFAQTVAFVQRCNDLREICIAQKHFGRWLDGKKDEMPIFGGHLGLEVNNGLEEIEHIFELKMQDIRNISSLIMDVKATNWHEHCNIFKMVVKDLEVMMQNIIKKAFLSVTTVEDAIEVIDVFMHLYNRETIRRIIDKKTVEIYALFSEEIELVKTELSNKNIYGPYDAPEYGGSGLWIRQLKMRLEISYNILSNATFLRKIDNVEECHQNYNNLIFALNENLNRFYNKWSETVDPKPLLNLTQTIMCTCSQRSDLLAVNFSPSLRKMFQECWYWERLTFELPAHMSEIYIKKDELIILRERVLLSIQEYNRIIFTLSKTEKGLFTEKIRNLQKKLRPGLIKIDWNTKSSVEYFLDEIRIHVKKIQDMIDSFKEMNVQISTAANAISHLLLFNVEDQKVYEIEEFIQYQKKHISIYELKIFSNFKDILSNLQTAKKLLVETNVEEYWIKYINKLDAMVEEAFRLNIKGSLQELNKLINGNEKTAANPLFMIKVALENEKIVFEPTLEKLSDVIVSIKSGIIEKLKRYKRLSYLVGSSGTGKSMNESIYEDGEINDVQQSITNGTKQGLNEMQAYLTTWDNFKEIWGINKPKFITRYRKVKPGVETFDADLARYSEVANNVQGIETIINIQFVYLNCGPLKFAILEHCNEWQNMFTGLLFELTEGSLSNLYEYVVENTDTIQKIPINLDELNNNLELWDQLNSELEENENKIPLLNDQFNTLDKYEVSIPEDVKDKHKTLQSIFNEFKQTLITSKEMLKREKEAFKKNLLFKAEEIRKEVMTLSKNLKQSGPYTTDVSIEKAFEIIGEFRESITSLTRQEDETRQGLAIFKISQQSQKEIVNIKNELNLIENIWLIIREWDSFWETSRVISFAAFNQETVESQTNNIFSGISSLENELKDREINIFKYLCDLTKQFQKTIPLINFLKNESIKKRHWHQIDLELGRQLDSESKEFTLEKIIEYEFYEHSEYITEVYKASIKEMALEKEIANIASTWEKISFNLKPYKDKGHFSLIKTDEIFQVLEDDQVSLSHIKSSKHMKCFETEIDNWEKSLSLISEVMENMLTVQQRWLYLENIFFGEDIRKQLPNEANAFEDINYRWKNILNGVNKDKNALRVSSKPGILKSLNDMNLTLETIQKSLDMYLETKKQLFPRFYFISNENLLEILGQSVDPCSIQNHLIKIFYNIYSLKIQKITVKQKIEATGMTSCDGETVDFNHPVLMEGFVELWLNDLEKQMRITLKDLLKNCRFAIKKCQGKRDKWIKEWPGQICITASKIQWTSDVTRALIKSRDTGERKPLKSLKKKQQLIINQYSDLLRSNITKLLRLKLTAIITIEIHSRDIIEHLIKKNVTDPTSFDWICQLRYYWDREEDDCAIKQTNAQFMYGYEYLGNSKKLVITPVTDRCYLTFTSALHFRLGGLPKGPAGTGKTETIKDFGGAMGYYVIVVNCSEGLDYKSMGRMFSGLAQTGAWGCFDEFNRINIEVLSVVAQQILSIFSSLRVQHQRFIFEGREIPLKATCAVFVTMNPEYKSRVELPDNLKSMFRPIAMIMPDFLLISETILFLEGFTNNKILAKKVYSLYLHATQQLSNQEHYDFGLRSIVSVLRYAGQQRIMYPNLSEEEIILLSIKDMNTSKLIARDLSIFNMIIHDLFPSIDAPTVSYAKFEKVVKEELCKNNLQITPYSVSKVVQLYETKKSRHATMLIGSSLSGKSTTIKILRETLTALSKESNNEYFKVLDYVINPKSLTLNELFGYFEHFSSQWSDGILSSLIRNVCSDERNDEKWVIFDGPVDSTWIESMNSLMDDNKILTLINGERIVMPENVSLIFEVDSLKVATPSTISRCGMVYHDSEMLGWRLYLDSWIDNKNNSEFKSEFLSLHNKYIPKILKLKKESCSGGFYINEFHDIISFCTLFDIFTASLYGGDIKTIASDRKQVEMTFIYSLIWSICSSVDENGRKRMDNFIREIDASIPTKDTIYEYYFNHKINSWAHWNEKLRTAWKYNPSIPFHKIVIPTIDTVRYSHIISELIRYSKPVILTGPAGCGKTTIIKNACNELKSTDFTFLNINLGAQTTAFELQKIIESQVEKRTKGVYMPVGTKKLILFMDDFNMPEKDSSDSQPPLELIRHWINYGFWYDQKSLSEVYIKNLIPLSAMVLSNEEGNNISPRLLTRYNILNITQPNESQIERIFEPIISQKLSSFSEDVKPIGELVLKATVEMYSLISTKLLPTPSKMHYVFNLRDISRVFQGVIRAEKDYHDSRIAITRLWIHECFRVFCDRLINLNDYDEFISILSEKLGNSFNLTYHNICQNKIAPIFVDFLNENGVYEDIKNFDTLKQNLYNHLDAFNSKTNVFKQDLVMFYDAVEHVSGITRILKQIRGHCLLIGSGGSGRKSLSRLATHICNYNIFELDSEVTLKKKEFHDELKTLMSLIGIDNKPTVFILSDTDIMEEEFLEDINNLLNTGSIPNLYKSEELDEIRNLLEEALISSGKENTIQNAYKLFLKRAQNNLHLIICLNPLDSLFRQRLRMYPSIVNCCTIKYFKDWPEEALKEIAEKYIDCSASNFDKIRNTIPSVFPFIHLTVKKCAKMMSNEKQKINYSPSIYLELINGFNSLFHEKLMELNLEAAKLNNGLLKIDETRAKVSIMSKELEEARENVAIFQKQCDEYLLVIVQQRREADEQQKLVSTKSEKIQEDEKKCQHMANLAQKDLNEVLPLFEEAIKALDSLSKKDITEIRSYGKPPPLVEKVLEAVMILRGNDTSWAEAKRQLSDSNFINQLKNFDKDNISDRVLKKIGGYVQMADFQPEIVGRVSFAAKSLCMWVIAMEVYGRVYRVIEPKRQRLDLAKAQLEAKQKELADAESKLQEVETKISELKFQYDDKLKQKEELKQKAEKLETMLNRAEKLVNGLANESERWRITVTELNEKIKNLPGDCVIAKAFLCYAGPFLSFYRNSLIFNEWIPHLTENNINCSEKFDFVNFMVNPAVVRKWKSQNLPSGNFSAENAILVTKGNRVSIIIDPQSQANNWIRAMDAENKLIIVDSYTENYIKEIENAIIFGYSVLFENVEGKIDPILHNLLSKSYFNENGITKVKVTKNLTVDPNFVIYVTTKLSTPSYSPELLSKMSLVNFGVKQQGLETQLLTIVVKKERPELEDQKNAIVLNIANGKKKLQELEDKILKLLNETEGSLLDDENLVDTLNSSKLISSDVTNQLTVAQQTEEKIDTFREGYLPCAKRASILFFILNNLANVDNMYQYSLESYINLFNYSIEKSQKSTKLDERIENLNDYHTYLIYKNTCRGLFERHKLLFSFQICVRIMEEGGKINMDEYSFFLKGGETINREQQMDNPCSNWLPESYWDHITELDKLTNFHGIMSSFEQYGKDWHLWYQSSEPENHQLPGEWDNACNDLQRMLIVRSIRPDRVPICVSTFVTNNLGSKYVEPLPLNMQDVFAESQSHTPLIFILSPGVDPTQALLQIAIRYDMNKKFHALSLGQGQSTIARRMIKEGVIEGNWVFLANCHLSLSWMPELNKIISQLKTTEIHPKFRLWLSSASHSSFPISILQNGIKMTTESPKGLKSNLKRLYNLVRESQVNRCSKPDKYRTLLFSLCFFHSVIAERKKFLKVGWNEPYQFNDADFEVANEILLIHIDEYSNTPWEALRYLISGITYGGHVTDDLDRTLLSTYISDYFNENIFTQANYKLSALPTYYVPQDSTLKSYLEYINILPTNEHPEVFGLHLNSEIQSEIYQTNDLFETLLLADSKKRENYGEFSEPNVLESISIITKQIPNILDIEAAERICDNENFILGSVLVQQVIGYNKLLNIIINTLQSLEQAILGLKSMTVELEDIFQAIHIGKVPISWGNLYPSKKPLSSWIRDLGARVQHFNNWVTTSRPPTIFWVSAFIRPISFLTSIQQMSAHSLNVSFDNLIAEYNVLTISDNDVTGSPNEGVLIKGMYLQGGGWDMKNACLIEPAPMQLIYTMPSIHVKHIEPKKKNIKGIYQCPVYLTSDRSDMRVCIMDIKSGEKSYDHWVKRGTAILLNLDD